MVKDRVFILVLVAIIIIGLMETNYIVSRFEYFEDSLQEIIELAEDENTDTEKLDELIVWWKKEKTKLHIFIPHYEIRDIDGVMIESKNLIEKENFDFATTLLRKLEDTVRALPHTFRPLFENIF